MCGNSAKGSLIGKLPSHGRLSWSAFSPSWQRHHHGNHIIMETTSSWQPHHHGNHIIMATTSAHHHQVVGKCKRSGTREFRFENILGCETLCLFSGKVAAVVAEGGSLFPRIGESCRKKGHETVARARFPLVSTIFHLNILKS